MKRILLTPPTVILATSLVACSTTPPRVEILDEARATIDSVEALPRSEEVASEELDEARRYLALSERHLEAGDELNEVRHDAYLALRHAEVAENRIAEVYAEQNIERSKIERSEVLLQARELEVEEARALAEVSAQEARTQAQRAQQAQAEADRVAARAQVIAAENEALERELAAMEADLEALEAEKTSRGLVLTLGDVLFETDRASLMPGADSTLDRIAAFLGDHEERRLLIEGHTDSRGETRYNDALSERRAGAVRDALVQRGVASARLEALGLGESYPVATNDTVAGRQQNRRVEIVVSAQDGSFPAGARRSIAQN